MIPVMYTPKLAGYLPVSSQVQAGSEPEFILIVCAGCTLLEKNLSDTQYRVNVFNCSEREICELVPCELQPHLYPLSEFFFFVFCPSPPTQKSHEARCEFTSQLFLHLFIWMIYSLHFSVLEG